MKKIEKSIELGGRKLTLQTGILAPQASGAILAQYGDTVVLATVVSSPLREDLGYFPLTVEYQERLYAGGRIKGSRWVKREGRPSDEEVLTARLIDRSIRPLFPQDYEKEVQVVITVLSVDVENDPTVLSAIATSAAISISAIPWQGPVVTLRVGMKEGTYITNPLGTEIASSDMDLVVSSTKDAVLMVEAGAKEVTEEEVIKAIEYALKESGKVRDLIDDLVKEAGQEKEALVKEEKDLDLEKKVKEIAKDKVSDLIKKTAKSTEGLSEFDDLKSSVISQFKGGDPSYISGILDKMFKNEIRSIILSGKRPDGRKLDEIRKLSMEVSVLPRTHGSAIFQRGVTQVLTVTTLGAHSLEQLIESAEGEESKRYIHHYSMPPYSTGETGRVGYPSRREIGHGALAERALEPAIPDDDVFPYTIRVVSEVTSSNGSTSMASVCGSTLSLMDAGVPLKTPIAGIAMGLIFEDKKATILSDIAGIEDFNGDMDFKVAGSKKGITALQLDVKTLNLTTDILKKALEQAKKGRAFILDTMLATISIPREKVSLYAPKIKVIKIAPEKIGEVIGPGGRTIKKMISETGAQIDIEDDGTINISGVSDEEVKNAFERVEALTKEIEAGQIYDGVVKRIESFGAFIEIVPGKEGMVHVSDMSEAYVKNPSDVVSMGETIKVRVKELDDLGRINLSMILDKDKEKPRQPKDAGRPSRGNFQRRGRFQRSSRSSGPHFPTSRFLDEPRKKFDR
ncbi:polyribonucleotide nucleotidyltransferase [Candidatus Woesebacteria bacterium RBG_16_36_11]|uniref:Polyribonucleotide nucleotidyltransferase n=3 Tax=Candidatus Woeseibacteriota TaxID=1752722 RepID=A0A1F7XBB7_9BACT|nr:MAG: polyribonucleotide nucleotidyltransferase [Candidatus Woesebacteria bacterium RBG_13_36_22]OGM12317.1 MAG: polyribonucleotide nucleotidyltransferase [Candidatus Woesebacteria bacterium RBG_16_36_11]